MRISDWSSDVCSSDLSDSSLTDGLLGHGKVIGVSCGAFLCIFGLLGFGGRFRRVASDAKSTDCGEQHGASHAAEEAFILCDHSTSPNFIWAVRAHRRVAATLEGRTFDDGVAGPVADRKSAE